MQIVSQKTTLGNGLRDRAKQLRFSALFPSSVGRQSVKRDEVFKLRTLYALTLYVLTPAENHNVRNTPDSRKLILHELLVRCGCDRRFGNRTQSSEILDDDEMRMTNDERMTKHD